MLCAYDHAMTALRSHMCEASDHARGVLVTTVMSKITTPVIDISAHDPFPTSKTKNKPEIGVSHSLSRLTYQYLLHRYVYDVMT